MQIWNNNIKLSIKLVTWLNFKNNVGLINILTMWVSVLITLCVTEECVTATSDSVEKKNEAEDLVVTEAEGFIHRNRNFGALNWHFVADFMVASEITLLLWTGWQGTQIDNVMKTLIPAWLDQMVFSWIKYWLLWNIF